MMSPVGHDVHNVTPTLHSMVEKAQFIDIVRCLCNLGFIWDVHYHLHLGEDIYAIHTVGLCYCFYECFASHVTRPPSKYDVRLNNRAYNLIPVSEGVILKRDKSVLNHCNWIFRRDVLQRASSSL